MEVCDIPDRLHYRFYPYRGGDLVLFSKECFSSLMKEPIKKDHSCFVLLYGHESTKMEELDQLVFLFRDGLGDIPHFYHNLFVVEAKYRGISLLIG